jgi:predicted sulfurtransferase
LEPAIFVFDERIALRESGERDLFPQVCHRIDVIHPQKIDCI